MGSTLIAAFGSSHSIMLTCTREDWVSRFPERDPRLSYFDAEGRPRSFADVHACAPADAARYVTRAAIEERFDATKAAMDRLHEDIRAARLDALVIVGDDQHELFMDEHMPAVAIYYGATIRNAPRRPVREGDWQAAAMQARLEPDAERNYPCDARLAMHLIEGLVARDFDVSTVKALGPEQFEGHAYSFVHHRYLHDAPVPIVPIFVNTYHPPNPPTPRRCLALGRALGALLRSYPGDARIGILASGGLSHFVVDEALDRRLIDALRARDWSTLAALDPRVLKSGSSEIRNWLVVGAAADPLTLGQVDYIPAYRTAALTGTGLAFARWG